MEFGIRNEFASDFERFLTLQITLTPALPEYRERERRAATVVHPCRPLPVPPCLLPCTLYSMPVRRDVLLSRISVLLAPMLPRIGGPLRAAIDRWRTDAAASAFHLQSPGRQGHLLLGIFGGTGTGKSTLVNRLLEQNLTAASFRRTFTTGAIAVASAADVLPEGWLGVEHVVASGADQFPLRGKPGALLVATTPANLCSHVTLIDTPDLDGDQPAHHAEADRVFRWVQAALFLVTPEKYQMTELLPYYRLAERYALPRLFVMNKAENQAAVDDYARQLAELSAKGQATTDAKPLIRMFSVPRDDAAYEPPGDANLAALRDAAAHLALPDDVTFAHGLTQRLNDIVGRLNDQVIAPLRERRLVVDRLIAALRAMETAPPGVDVNPITQQLRQRLQQRSILYLMGPQRMLDRLRQAPGLLARMPRVAWDYVRTGEVSVSAFAPVTSGKPEQPPDFRAILADQFAVVQSRIDDVLRSSPSAAGWIADPVEGAGYTAERFDPADAGKIADEEIADLRGWLDKRWDATPRDTRILMALLKHLPGGKQLTRFTEAAPYLLTLALVVHHALFGMDLLVLGGYSLATWLTEKLSNEVSGRTRSTNQRISDRFTRLAHEQIQRTCRWLDERAPSFKTIAQLEALAAECEPTAD
jgi:hypothetical protein